MMKLNNNNKWNKKKGQKDEERKAKCMRKPRENTDNMRCSFIYHYYYYYYYYLFIYIFNYYYYLFTFLIRYSWWRLFFLIPLCHVKRIYLVNSSSYVAFHLVSILRGFPPHTLFVFFLICFVRFLKRQITYFRRK